jgi:hypothetical protein
LRFHRFMLGDGLGALELFSALLATVLIGRHGSAHHDGSPATKWKSLSMSTSRFRRLSHSHLPSEPLRRA